MPESASEEEIIFDKDPKVEVDHGGCPTMTEEVVEVSSTVPLQYLIHLVRFRDIVSDTV